VLAERPIIYLWHQKWLYAMSAKLAGFTPYPDGLIRPQGSGCSELDVVAI
jgi:peptide/nickel transport system substrate-binding protein